MAGNRYHLDHTCVKSGLHLTPCQKLRCTEIHYDMPRRAIEAGNRYKNKKAGE